MRPPSDDPIAVTLERLRELMGLLLQPEPAFSYGLRWLEDHKPDEPARCSIVHGDARNGNLIVSETGLVGILDWEGAHIGDPMDDVAWPCTRMWRFGEDEKTVGGLARVPVLRDGLRVRGRQRGMRSGFGGGVPSGRCDGVSASPAKPVNISTAASAAS